MNALRQLSLVAIILLLTACGEEPASTDEKDASLAGLDQDARWGMELAREKCDSCHAMTAGKPGQDVPFITGQNKLYILAALESYIRGGRNAPDKLRILDKISTQEKEALAHWFASRDKPWYGKDTFAPAVLKEYRNPAAISKGKAVASPCFSCHGEDGNSVKEGVPSLAGLQPSYFRAALKAYTTGARQGAQVMKNFKLALNDTTIRQLASYFTHQSRKRSSLPTTQGNPRRGANKARSCFGCHGPDGNSFNPEFPGLAGQNAAYLEKAVLHYQNGNRKDELMKKAVKGLGKKDIRDIAAWFASQEPVSAVAARSAGEKTFDPIKQGETLARACNGCHGENGISSNKGVASLAGLAQPYFRRAIQNYQNGNRDNAVMALQVKSLSGEEIEKISLYYASLSPLPPAPDAAELMRREQEGLPLADVPQNPPAYIASCNGCHGTNGNSMDVNIPSLAGQEAGYLQQAMTDYANGSRKHEDMAKAIQSLDAERIRTVAAYYASVAAVALPFRAPESPQQIASRCNHCHGKDGFVSDPKTPRIAGQAYPYLVRTLQQYQRKERDSSIMQKMTSQLSPLEIQAIARYYAGK